jgi:Membrane-bound toxin component of toxin-antitoxin system
VTLDHKPVEINLKRSRFLLLWIIAIHCFASAALLSLGLPILFVTPLLVIILVGFYVSFQRWCNPAWQTVICDEGCWILKGEKGVQEVSLRWFYRFGQWVILGFRMGKHGKVTLSLFPDAVSDEQLRQLRQVLLLATPASYH